MDKLEIKYLPINEIVGYEKNVIDHSDVQNLVRSIESFGFKIPILINNKNVIIAGHGRLLAAKQLGLTELPTIDASDLTEEQQRLFRVADNKTSKDSSWNMENLQSELDELASSGADFIQSGFSQIEIDDFFSNDFQESDDEDVEENFEEAKFEDPKKEQKEEEKKVEPKKNDRSEVKSINCPKCGENIQI